MQSWIEFSRSVKSGATAGRVAATVVSRTERRTKTGNKMGIFGLSDPSGHYEAIMFAEGLQQYRDILEPGVAGAAVSHARRRRATRCAPASSRPSRSIRPRPSCRRACACSCATKRRSSRSPSGLDGKGDGEVSFVLQLDGGAEVEIRCRAASRSRRRSPAPSRRCPACSTCSSCSGTDAACADADRISRAVDPSRRAALI